MALSGSGIGRPRQTSRLRLNDGADVHYAMVREVMLQREGNIGLMLFNAGGWPVGAICPSRVADQGGGSNSGISAPESMVYIRAESQTYSFGLAQES
mgnify:CR=1 FL=1